MFINSRIFGLLVAHGKDSGYLTVNFAEDESVLFIGEETNATMAFISIIHNLDKLQ